MLNINPEKGIIIAACNPSRIRIVDDEKAAAGITPGLIRIAVGLENIDDIINDFNVLLTA